MLKCSKETGVEIGGATLKQLFEEFSVLTAGLMAGIVADGTHDELEAEAELRLAFRNGIGGAKMMIADGAHKTKIQTENVEKRKDNVPEFLKQILSAAKDAGAKVEVVVMKGDEDEHSNSDGALN